MVICGNDIFTWAAHLRVVPSGACCISWYLYLLVILVYNNHPRDAAGSRVLS